jgi:conjugal transfer/type IV secretion protein DotA/TraY
MVSKMMTRKNWLQVGVGALLLSASVGAYAGTSEDMLAAIFGVDVMKLVTAGGANVAPAYGLGDMGKLMARFCQATLFVGILIFGYVLASAAVQTADDGEFLGRRYSSVWMPFRIVWGFIMAMPTPLGYCGAQILVLWMAVMGINIANAVIDIGSSTNVTAKLLDPMRMVAAPKLIVGDAIAKTVGDMSRAYLDVELYNKDIEATSADVSARARNDHDLLDGASRGESADAPPKPNYAGLEVAYEKNFSLESGDPDVSGKQKSLGDVFIVRFGKPLQDSKNNVVGYSTEFGRFLFTTTATEPAEILNQRRAIQALVEDAGVIAKSIRDKQLLLDSPDYKQRLIDSAARYSAVMLKTARCEQLKAVLSIAQEFGSNTNIITSRPEFSGCAGLRPAAGTGASANRPDWTGAGLAYLASAAGAKGATRTANTAPIKMPPDEPDLAASGQLYGEFDTGATPTASVAADPGAFGAKAAFDKAKAGAKEYSDFNGWAKSAIAVPLVKALTGHNGDPSAGNPIAHMKKMGDLMMYSASLVWLTSTVAKSTIDGFKATADAASNQPAGGLLAVPFAGVLGALSSAFGSLFSMVMSFLPFIILTGSTLAVYLPLLPFFLWVVAIIGWLITAVEAVIASPIMSVLHLSPEGDGIATQRVEGWYILAMSLLLRPVLLTFGFFFSIAILEVAGGFANAGFFTLSNRMIDDHDSIFSLLTFMVGLAGAYIGMMIMIIYKSFEVIQVVPDRVFRLIGASEPGGGNDSHASQPFSQAVQPMASAGAGALAAGGRSGGGGGGGNRKNRDDGGGGAKSNGPATAAENKSGGSSAMSSGFAGAGTSVTSTTASSSRYTPGQAAPKS